LRRALRPPPPAGRSVRIPAQKVGKDENPFQTREAITRLIGRGRRADARKERSLKKGKEEDVSETEAFLTRAEVSRLFGVSPSTVTRWARVGLLRAVRTPGGHYRFPESETRKAAQRAAAGELTRLD
jgi:excisionase family DNA binding protein